MSPEKWHLWLRASEHAIHRINHAIYGKSQRDVYEQADADLSQRRLEHHAGIDHAPHSRRGAACPSLRARAP